MVARSPRHYHFNRSFEFGDLAALLAHLVIAEAHLDSRKALKPEPGSVGHVRPRLAEEAHGAVHLREPPPAGAVRDVPAQEHER